MDKATANRVAELREEIARFTKLNEWATNHLAKYPQDTITAEMANGYQSVITRASNYIQAVTK